ncbi:MAG: hypothetical protein ACRDD1_09105, partial [Planctomycetia bacterium]
MDTSPKARPADQAAAVKATGGVDADVSQNKAVSAIDLHFCRAMGMLGGVTGPNAELEALLRRRLTLATGILAGGFFAYMVRGFFYAPIDRIDPFVAVVLRDVTTVVLVGLTGLLLTAKDLCLARLRGIELTVFGMAAAFFLVLQSTHGVFCCALGDRAWLQVFAATSCLPWISLVSTYGLFIPNTSRRATAVISIMVFLPIFSWLSLAWNHPPFFHLLFADGQLSQMLLWLAIPAASAIYGSIRIGALEQEAAEARKLGSYTLGRKLGAGGMGEVYLASHEMLTRPCAIKLIHGARSDAPKALARFESEVQTTANLTHPNTIDVFD